MTTGRLASIDVSRGGVPKRSLVEALITEKGVDSDRQAQRQFHGGPERASCLFRIAETAGLKPCAPYYVRARAASVDRGRRQRG